jgi:hypothetical protein
VCQEVLHGASGLSDCVIKMNAAFFNGNKYCVCAKRFAHACKTLTTLHVAVFFNSAAMDDTN